MLKTKKTVVVATAGVLPYFENGKVIYKLKRPEDIRKFIGKPVAIVDEHPATKQIDTLTPILGTEILEGCPLEKDALCMAYDSEKYPKKKGFSLGFWHDEIMESGIFEGNHYDTIQVLTNPDHVALTDTPRNAKALVSGDSWENVGSTYVLSTDSQNSVDKKTLSFDCYREFDFPDEEPTMEKDEIIADLKAELAAYQVEKKLTETKKGEIDSLASEIEKLKSQNAVLQAEVDGFREKEKKEQEKKMNEVVAYLQSKKINIDSLESKDFGYLKGIHDTLKKLDVTSDVKIVDTKKKREGDSKVELDSEFNYRFDVATQKFVKKEGK